MLLEVTATTITVCCEKDVRNIRLRFYSLGVGIFGIRFCGLFSFAFIGHLHICVSLHIGLPSLGRPGHVRTEPSPPATQFGGTSSQKQEVQIQKAKVKMFFARKVLFFKDCFLANIGWSEAGIVLLHIIHSIYNG